MRYNGILRGFCGFMAVSLVWAVNGVYAQESGDLNRQMEVMRDYEPTVEKADKIGIEPNMVDTVTLKPEVSYKVTPTPVSYGFEPAPIKAAAVNTEMNRLLSPLYVKAGAGAPFRSLLDVYYSPQSMGDGRFGVYLNHTGRWSKIENDSGVKAPAAHTVNKAGIFGGYRFGRLGVDGEIGYDYDMFSRYGYYVPAGGTPVIGTDADDLRQRFSTLRGRIGFGNAFEDLSYFNFRLGVDAAHFNDRFDHAETDFKAYLSLGKLFNDIHEFTLRAQYQVYKGGKNLDYSDNIVSITPLYRYRADRLDVALGFTYSHGSLESGGPVYPLNENYGQGASPTKNSKGYFFPLLEIKLDIADGYFIPYAEIDGRLSNNGYRSIAGRNPYVMQGSFAYDTEEYNGRAGITGSISSAFSYKAYLGYSAYKNLNMFVNLYDGAVSEGNLFSCIRSNADMFTIGGELEGRISGSFGVDVSLQYKSYDMKQADKPIGLPELEGRLGLKYDHRDKLTVKAGVGYIGRRYFCDGTVLPDSSVDLVLTRQKAAIDLTLGAEYSITSRIGAFVEFDNLLDQELYPFGRYRGFGVSGLGGVKLSF